MDDRMIGSQYMSYHTALLEDSYYSVDEITDLISPMFPIDLKKDCSMMDRTIKELGESESNQKDPAFISLVVWASGAGDNVGGEGPTHAFIGLQLLKNQ
jgi:hypothetical protein